MYTLATLTALRRHLGLADADTADDARLTALLVAASARVEYETGRRFSPHRLALVHPFPTGGDPTLLILRDDLLALEALTDAVGTVAPADAALLPDTGGAQPYSAVQLLNGRAFAYSASREAAITVTGTWGCHTAWASAWRASGDSVQNNPLTASALTITVTDADGADAHGALPRFQVGQLIRLAAEYVRVLAVNTAANTLTVMRGVNGTTAAAHAPGTPIDIFAPMPLVETLVVAWAAWLYRAPDLAPGSGFERGRRTAPPAPAEAFALTLAALRRPRV